VPRPAISISTARRWLRHNELDSTITTYRQDRRSGALTPLQTIPVTPSEFTGYSTGAEISVDRAGRNVYVSNRGHDSIGVFGIDRSKGTLSPRQWVPTHGRTPRFFAFDPDQRFLYVANQDSRSIATASAAMAGSHRRVSARVGGGLSSSRRADCREKAVICHSFPVGDRRSR
jgi:hypothetical protein